MAATVPSLKEVLSSFGDEKDVYLYIPLKKTKVTAFMLVDHLLKKGEHKRYPSLVFHPLHHALHLTAAPDSLTSFRDRNPTISIGSTRLGVYWSQKPRAPYVPKPKLFKVRIRGVKTISEQNKLAEALHTSVTPETYNGVTLGTHVFSVPSLSAELIEQIKGSPCRVSFHPINFCRNCLQRFSARPSLHKCSSSSSEHPKSEVNEARVPSSSPLKDEEDDTKSPCGGETGDSPLTGSSTTPAGDEPEKLSLSDKAISPPPLQMINQTLPTSPLPMPNDVAGTKISGVVPTKSPCGGGTGDSPLTGSSTTLAGDEPEKLSPLIEVTSPPPSPAIDQTFIYPPPTPMKSRAPPTPSSHRRRFSISDLKKDIELPSVLKPPFFQKGLNKTNGPTRTTPDDRSFYLNVPSSPTTPTTKPPAHHMIRRSNPDGLTPYEAFSPPPTK